MQLTTNTLKILNTTIKTIFNKAFSGTESEYKKIAMEVPSTKGSNTYAWLGNFAKLREWIGDRVVNNLKNHEYTLKNKTYEGTVAIEVEAIEDDDVGIYTPIIEDMGYSAATHPDELVFGVAKDGTKNKCYDGQNFFDKDHPVVDEKGKTVSVANYQSGDKPFWMLIDAKRPIRPFIYQKRKDYKLVTKDDDKDENVFNKNVIIYGVDGRGNAGYGLWQLAFGSNAELTKENLEAAYAAMCEFKGDKGKVLGVKPTLLVVPPSLRAKANEIITNDRLANGESNPNKNLVAVMDTAWLA